MAAPVIADYITRLRNDLHDNDAAAYRWTDAVLQRHIEHAVRDFTLARPLEQKTTLSTTSGSRNISISTLTDLITIEQVEYPVGYFPNRLNRFAIWQTTLTLLSDSTPASVGDVYIYWYKVHSLTASVTTIPTFAEDIIAIGAGGYAAIEWANYAPNRVNTGGILVWKDYLTWGEDQLRTFREMLTEVHYRHRLKTNQLHQP